jgi:glycosyltransferase involved in cell wall biosynthesis
LELFKKTTINEQEIEVSIIIPSYNKYPLNVFTLYTLEKQNFDHSKYEVIFIDDASTDQTFEKLKDYQPNYHFHYIRCNENMGRAKVRNLGINSSRGKLLIMLDAEMIVDPYFIWNHYIQHQLQDDLILSGIMYYKLAYTCIFPNFNSNQMKEVKVLAKKNPLIYKRYKKYEPYSTDILPLLEKEEINSNVFEDLIMKNSNWFNSITDNYGPKLEGLNFPWMSFLTGNVSLRRDLILKAGLFDEDFVNYGYEDWELGYRLYKLGGKFLQSDKVITYHQVHPIGKSNWTESIGNYHLFKQKHPDVDVLILGLEMAHFCGLTTMNHVLGEFKDLVATFPNEFLLFRKNFMELLETVDMLLYANLPHKNILGAAGFGTEQKENLLNEVSQIEMINKYPHLTKIVRKLINS